MNFSNDIQTCWMDKFYIKKNFQFSNSSLNSDNGTDHKYERAKGREGISNEISIKSKKIKRRNEIWIFLNVLHPSLSTPLT